MYAVNKRLKRLALHKKNILMQCDPHTLIFAQIANSSLGTTQFFHKLYA